MDDILFIQEFYYYLLSFFIVLIPLSLIDYVQKDVSKVINLFTLVFALFTFLYIGSRDLNIGVDTQRYEKAFMFYKKLATFEIRKDIFYDVLSFSFAQFFSFSTFLKFCAFLYVFTSFIGLKKIFGKKFFLPFLIFLISPYFIANGISALRSGIAASFFILGLGYVYEKRTFPKAALMFLLGVFFHISMVIPLLLFVLANFIKNTKVLFIIWLCSIILGYLNINIIVNIVTYTGVFEDRVGNYAVNEGERNFWMNFALFGFIPVVFAVYNVLILKYKNVFYTWLLNAYMMIHIPYIILIESQYGLRLGYLAEFMLPILLLFPLFINPVIKFKLLQFKMCVLIFFIFLVKAYKILSV